MTSTPHSLVYALDGPANALALNRDGTRVAVAGRTICKLYTIEENYILENLNLKPPKTSSLNYSSTDVAWNPNDDNILATSATNGAVVIWNLGITSRNKHDVIFNDHKRTANRVVFHSSESHFLLSGSQDGTMKLFDLRKKEAASTFDCQSVSVRDVQFSPHLYFIFVAVRENGNVQFWDLRKPDRWTRQFPAHNGPVFTCDWHPEEKKWLATAGRDKTIKIWDTTVEPIMDYSIQTIASVAKVKWRPDRKYNIASCSLVLDFSINIWDIRRPYIPFGTFAEHKDMTTGICWRYDPQILISTSKDKTLCQHVIKDALRPADKAIPIGININNYGDISFVASNKIIYDNAPHSSRTGPYSSARLPAFFRKGQTNPSEQFRNSLSTFIYFHNNQDKNLSMNWFVESALKYQLSGLSFSELCENNAQVAKELKRPFIAQIWRMLDVFYSSQIPSDKKNDTTDAMQDSSTLKSSRHNSGNTRNHHFSGNKPPSRHISTLPDHPVGETPIQTEEDSEASVENHDDSLTNIASGLAARESFFFGEYDANEFNTLVCRMPPEVTDDEWMIPTEAFQLRNPIKETILPQPDKSMPNEVSENLEVEKGSNKDHELQHPVLIPPDLPSPPPWQFSDNFVNILHIFAENGDVQMSVSMLIILGDRISSHIKESIQEQWFTAYIDLLHRFQLWNVANEVIRLSALPSISTLNQESTSIHSGCGKCSARLSHCGWKCSNCKETTTSCSVCHRTVRGLFTWCQSCGHGGHINHLLEWFQSNCYCPSGCGHTCEYT